MSPPPWRPGRALIQLRDQIDAAHPGRPTASDGILGDASHSARESDHNPDSRRIVCAIDITSQPWTQPVVDALVASRDPRIKYIIWNRRIIDSHVSPWKWMPYTGDNPHTKHFHLSVMARLCDETRPWQIGQWEDELSAAEVKAINDNTNRAVGRSNMDNSKRTATILAAIAADPDNPVTQQQLNQAVATNNEALAAAVAAKIGGTADVDTIKRAVKDAIKEATD